MKFIFGRFNDDWLINRQNMQMTTIILYRHSVSQRVTVIMGLECWGVTWYGFCGAGNDVYDVYVSHSIMIITRTYIVPLFKCISMFSYGTDNNLITLIIIDFLFNWLAQQFIYVRDNYVDFILEIINFYFPITTSGMTDKKIDFLFCLMSVVSDGIIHQLLFPLPTHRLQL